MARLITYAKTGEPAKRADRWGEKVTVEILVQFSDMTEAIFAGGDTLIARPYSTCRQETFSVEWYNGYCALKLGRAPFGDFAGTFDSANVDKDILRLLTFAHENGLLDQF